MKINFIIITIFLWKSFLISYISSQCFYHPNNIIASLENVECEWNSNNFILTQDVPNTTTDDMFKIQLNCKLDNLTCEKVLMEFNKAAKLITSTFIFNTQIRVNVSYYDFCTIYPEDICQDLGGAAYPTQFYLLQDDDGISRLYPQSLVKQFQFSNTPNYNEFDINAEFNSKSGFWFEQDLTTIKPDQGDIYWTICHELMHGLGFYNGWMGYQNNPIAVIPMPTLINSDGTVPKNNLFSIESSFVEFMMDKYTILLSNGTKISSYVQKLNTFFTEYKTNAFNDEFVKSPQFVFAQELLILATTPNSLGLLPRDSFINDSIILETSITPFEQGSNLIHVDYKTYINTSDFLMTYKIIDGITTDQMVLNNGGGPIGPKLKQIMETFGYATADNPNPYRPQPFKPPPSPIKKSSSTNSSFKPSIIRTFNILLIILLLFIISLYFF